MRVKQAVPKGVVRSFKLQQHLRKMPNQGKFVDITRQTENNWRPYNMSESSCSSVEVLNGSFSEILPIGAPRIAPQCIAVQKQETYRPPTAEQVVPQFTPVPMCEDIFEDENEGVGNSSKDEFVTSHSTPAPIYEDISDNEGAGNSSTDAAFSFETEVVQESENCDSFIKEIQGFIERSGKILLEKTEKLEELYKKRTEYQQKINHMEKAIRKIKGVIILTTKMSAINVAAGSVSVENIE